MAEDEKKTELHFVNKPSQISPHEFLQFGLIIGEGRGGGAKREGGA